MLQSKRAVKPKTRSYVDAYQHYASKLLKENEDYWGKRKNNVNNYYICKKSSSKVIDITNYLRYKQIVEAFFKVACTKLIEGRKLYLLNRNGYLLIKKIERNFKKLQINWGESNKAKKELIEKGEVPLKGDNKGKPWLVYYTDDEYYRIAWVRPYRTLNNIKFYKFVPARGNKNKPGFKEMMSRLIKARPEIRARYNYFQKDGEIQQR